MKRSTTAIASVFIILLLAAGTFYYFNQNNQKTSRSTEESNRTLVAQKDVREIVWEQLPAEQKDAIDGTWSGRDNSYIGKEIYLINSPARGVSVPDDLVVYAGIETHHYIGSAFTD